MGFSSAHLQNLPQEPGRGRAFNLAAFAAQVAGRARLMNVKRMAYDEIMMGIL